jgi:flagellar motor switch protein FliG
MVSTTDEYPRLATARPGLSGARKAAVFLLTLDEPEAAAILRRLPAEAVDEISREIARLGEVPSLVRWRVMQETLDALAEQQERQQAAAAGPDQEPFAMLRSVGTAAIVQLIQEENPQTIALVLAHLPSGKASEVLVCLPTHKQVDVVRRIAGLQETSPDVIHELESALQQRLNENEPARRQ